MTTKDDGTIANTTKVCNDAGCTSAAKVDVADSNTSSEVKTLRERVNELENSLSTYGLLKKKP
jgi:outer membrane murein-binding lipoprotein Lpp